MIGGLYRAGGSPLHRLSPGPKLLGLIGLGTLLFAVAALPLAVAALIAVLALFALARIPLPVLFAQLRPALVVLAVLFVAQLVIDGWMPAALLVTRFATLILAASLVTLTTRTADLVATLERAMAPLRYVGVDTARISLAISLAIRFIPAIGTAVEEVREAQRARGRDRPTILMLVPIIVRLLKMADEVAEAIDARS